MFSSPSVWKLTWLQQCYHVQMQHENCSELFVVLTTFVKPCPCCEHLGNVGRERKMLQAGQQMLNWLWKHGYH